MPIVLHGEESYECSRAVKGVDYIKLYDDSNVQFIGFYGISDFSEFTLQEGQWEKGVSTQLVSADAVLSAGAIVLTLLKSVSVETGLVVTFRAPCSCEDCNLIYIDKGYTLVDAVGEPITANAFATGAIVSVILDSDTSKAYIQNAAAAGVTSKDFDEHTSSTVLHNSSASGCAFGRNAKAESGGAAIGALSSASKGGGAIGSNASAQMGGAVGYAAKTSDGFAGGWGAQAIDDDGNPIDAIQLGSGQNNTEGTFQVYSHRLMNADGTIPSERIKAVPVIVDGSWQTNGSYGYKKTITSVDILETDNPVVDISLGSDAGANKEYLKAWECISSITTADGSITLYAYGDYPKVAFTIQLKVV